MAWTIASIPLWVSGTAFMLGGLIAAWNDVPKNRNAEDWIATILAVAVLLSIGGIVFSLAAKMAS